MSAGLPGAGVNVTDYVRAYPGRFPLIHVKECTQAAKNAEEMEHFPKRIFHSGLQKDPETGVPILTEEMKQELYETRSWNGALGAGIIDWPSLVAAADAQGCEAYISEREYYHIPVPTAPMRPVSAWIMIFSAVFNLCSL